MVEIGEGGRSGNDAAKLASIEQVLFLKIHFATKCYELVVTTGSLYGASLPMLLASLVGHGSPRR